MRQIVVEKVWERDFDLRTRRRNFIFFISGLYICAAVAGILVPLILGQPQTFSLIQQILASALIVGAGIAANWRALETAAAHVIVATMFVLFVSASYTRYGINTAFTVLMPLLPAVAALLIGLRTCVIYMVLVMLSLIWLLFVDSEFGYQSPGTIETSKALMLAFATIFVATVSIYVVSLNERLSQALKSKGGFDEVTNLPNRFFLRDWLNDTLDREAGTGKRLTLLSLGIDNFGSYNEQLGNHMGDEAMSHTAAALQSIIDPLSGAVLVRNRGNSFVIALLEFDQERADRIAQRTQTAVNALKLPGVGSEYLTVSVGMLSCILDERPESSMALVEYAVGELQTAQATGQEQISRNMKAVSEIAN